MQKKYKKSFWLPALLFVYMTGMAVYFLPRNHDMAATEKFVTLGVGYLIGGLMKSGQGATNLATAVQLIALFTSGVAFPFTLLPESALKIVNLLPTAYFGDLLFWTTGSPLQRYSTWLDFLIVTICALVIVPLAIRTFRWDTREK